MIKPLSRKSWFSFSRQKPKSTKAEEASIVSPADMPPAAAPDGVPNSNSNSNRFSAYNSDPQERLRPIQFEPNRVATLYVSPSERNLYLAAMSQLDQSPPPLPLWTDPAPELPRLNPTDPLDPPLVPSSYTITRPTPGLDLWTDRLYNPKLFPGGVYDPPFSTGLFVRDEFRSYSARKSTNHAIIALTPPGEIRFTNFPPSALLALDNVIRDQWPQGIVKRSLGVIELKERDENDKIVWTANLEGKVWKRKGNEELDTIRFMLGIFKVLGTHGWTLAESIQAGGSKKDTHDLLFSYSLETTRVPPAFFALSIPLPDRLSLINPPLKSTPALISALRTSIISSSPFKLKQSSNGIIDPTFTDAELIKTMEQGKKKGRITWQGYDPRGIKLEGWVHDGVYRFWIDGMRRWMGGALKRKTVENIHPMLVISIINNLTANHFQLAGSVPLLPFTKGRDVLVFQSLPSSGLTAQDSFDTKQYNYNEGINPRGPTAAGTPGKPMEILAHQAKTSTRPPRPPAATTMTRLRQLSDLTLRRRSSGRESPNRHVATAPSSGAEVHTQERTPKAKNVLLKKNSTRRRSVPNMPNSTVANHVGNGQIKRGSAASVVPSQGQVQGSDGTAGFAQGDAHLRAMNAESQDRASWSFVERPTVQNQEGRAPPIEISGISPIRNLWNAPLDLPPSNNTNRDPTQFGTTQLFVPPGTGHAPKLQNGPGRESRQGLGAMLVNAQDYGGSLQFLDSPTSLAHQAEKVGSARTKVNVGPGH